MSTKAVPPTHTIVPEKPQAPAVNDDTRYAASACPWHVLFLPSIGLHLFASICFLFCLCELLPSRLCSVMQCTHRGCEQPGRHCQQSDTPHAVWPPWRGAFGNKRRKENAATQADHRQTTDRPQTDTKTHSLFSSTCTIVAHACASQVQQATIADPVDETTTAHVIMLSRREALAVKQKMHGFMLHNFNISVQLVRARVLISSELCAFVFVVVSHSLCFLLSVAITLAVLLLSNVFSPAIAGNRG